MTRASLSELAAYAEEFRAAATHLRTYRLAREWMEAGQPADVAAAWANLGYTPAEALPRIAAGLSPEQAAEMDDAQLGDGDEVDKLAAWVTRFDEDPRLVMPPEA